MANAGKAKRPSHPSVDTTLHDTGHLLRRAGFGAPPAEIASSARQGLKATVNRLVDFEQTPDTFTPPPDSLLGAKRYGVNELGAWWLSQMITTSRPLQEKMTLFWHGHFATAIQKVGYTALMYRQNQLFRQNALARFDDILTGVYKDPAMLIWLDGRLNSKQAPNENFGREVMELFTLGHGNYSEDDVHASSRAWTGWRLTQDFEPTFVPRLHDDGVKTLLGQTGNWGADDAVRILCSHPATGRFLATKLWQFFASDQPPASAVKKLASVYDSSDHSIREMVRTLFSLPEFYSQATRTGHIKSPVEFVVGAVQHLGLRNVDLSTYPRILATLGQQLFNPPNVGGWPGGPSWINAATMLGRFNFASQFAGDSPRGAGIVDPDAILAASNAATTAQLASYICGVLGLTPTGSTVSALLGYAGNGLLESADGDGALEAGLRRHPSFVSTDEARLKIRGLVHLAMISPEYQVS